MIIVFIRAILLYTAVLVSLRLMGKGELAEMQPYELVITLMMAELAALPMENVGAPLINGIVAIITLLFVQVLISYITLKSEKARGIICGKPSILINKGKINEKELKKLRININDLMEQIRAKDYPSMGDVEFAILETSGELSVIPKEGKRPVALEDLNIKKDDEGLPRSLIIDGHVKDDNLKDLDLTRDWLDKKLKGHGIKNPNEVLFAFIDSNKKINIQKKDEN